MTLYIQVADDEHSEPVELPLEDDDTLLLSTLAAQYPGTCGLKYRNSETGILRGLRVIDGRLYRPEGGWQNTIFICVFSKEERGKTDDLHENYSEMIPKERKQTCSDLIVLGLAWKTTESELRQYFEAYGEVVLAQIKKDPQTGQSRGFGFIRFSDHDVQMQVLAQKHLIGERWCIVKIPNSKVAQQQQQWQYGGASSIGSMSSESPTPHVPCKVFVGRCTEDMTAGDLRDYFEKFGEVTDVFIPRPFRAFAFVTFTEPDVAQSLCGEDHIINGSSVHVSSAAPKSDSNRTPWGAGPGGRGYDSGRGVPPWEPWAAPREFPDLSALGSSLGISQSGSANGATGATQPSGATAPMGPAPVNLGALPMNASVVAAALNQAGWGILSNLQQEGAPPQGAYQSSYSTASAPSYSATSPPQGYPAGGNHAPPGQYLNWMNQVEQSGGSHPSSTSQVPVWQQRDKQYSGNRREW